MKVGHANGNTKWHTNARGDPGHQAMSSHGLGAVQWLCGQTVFVSYHTAAA